ncbi:MAG: hypothetical protein JSS86_09965 [Cyanobacteria bacterium SZAS LIN-2]|nr:hypothetical protein [Cyanobacteria bacterium SZAS LIN-2]
MSLTIKYAALLLLVAVVCFSDQGHNAPIMMICSFAAVVIAIRNLPPSDGPAFVHREPLLPSRVIKFLPKSFHFLDKD